MACLLQGGWRDASMDPLQSQMGIKISWSVARQQLAGLQRQISDVAAQLESAEMRQRDMRRRAAAMQALAAEKSRVTEQLADAQSAISRLTPIQAQLQEQLEHLHRQLDDKQDRQRQLADTSGGGDPPGEGLAVEALIAETHALVTQTDGELAAAQAEAQALADELAVCSAVSAEQLSHSRQQLADASSNLRQADAVLSARASAAALAEEEVQRLWGILGAAEQAVNQAEAARKEFEAAVSRFEVERSRLACVLSDLVQEVPELGATEALPGRRDLAELQLAIRDLQARRSALLQQRTCHEQSDLASDAQLHIQQRAKQLAASKLQASTVLTATEQLQRGMAESHGNVLAVNEAVFESVAATFSSLAAAVLPAIRACLAKVGGFALRSAHRSTPMTHKHAPRHADRRLCARRHRDEDQPGRSRVSVWGPAHPAFSSLCRRGES